MFPYDVTTDTLEEPADCTVDVKLETYQSIPSRKKICRDWSNDEFFVCARRQMEKAVREENFTCSVIWWRDVFPSGTPECRLPEDESEIQRIR